MKSKNHRIVGILILLLTLTITLVACDLGTDPADPDPEFYNLSGTVTIDGGEATLADVGIEVNGDETSVDASDGSWSVENMEAGTVSIKPIIAEEYADDYKWAVANDYELIDGSVQIDLTSDLDDLDFTAFYEEDLIAIIFGPVENKAEEPIQGAIVTLTSNPVFTAETDEEGRAAMEVKAGLYDWEVRAEGYVTQSGSDFEVTEGMAGETIKPVDFTPMAEKELMVEAVTAIDALTVEVEYSQKVNERAGLTGSYTIKNIDEFITLDIDNVDLDATNKVATITLDSDTPLISDEEHRIEFSNIQNIADETVDLDDFYFTPDFPAFPRIDEENIIILEEGDEGVFDILLPESVFDDGLAGDTAQISLEDADETSLGIASVDYTEPTEQQPGSYRVVLDGVDGEELTAGEVYKLTIKENNLKDIYFNQNAEIEITFTATEPEILTAELTSATLAVADNGEDIIATLYFSENVVLADTDDFEVILEYEGVANSWEVTYDTEIIKASEIEVVFDEVEDGDLLAEERYRLSLVNTDNELKTEFYETVVESAEIEVAGVDTVPAVIESVIINSAKEILIKFDKDIELKDAYNFNVNGKTVANGTDTTASVEGKTLTITATEDDWLYTFPQDTNDSMVISGTDGVLAITSGWAFDFNVSAEEIHWVDTEAEVEEEAKIITVNARPEVVEGSYENDSDSATITLTFSEDVEAEGDQVEVLVNGEQADLTDLDGGNNVGTIDVSDISAEAGEYNIRIFSGEIKSANTDFTVAGITYSVSESE